MRAVRATLLILVLFLLCSGVLRALGNSGHIEGRISRPDGSGIAGVLVTIDGTSSYALTYSEGRFEFKQVPAGTYSLTFTLKPNTLTVPDITVEAGSTVTVNQVVDWDVSIVESIVVKSASRRLERIVDAPASVTKIEEEEIERQSVHGMVPKLFEFTPGVDITQTGANDFLVTPRGFNTTLNRRTAVLLDGRDITDPFVGATEWSTVTAPLDDLSEVELLRGPSSALYGANATGGVVSLTSKEPRHSLGGMVRLSGGEKSTAGLDFRWAGDLGGGWYMKAVGGLSRSDGFVVSRLDSVEYSIPCDAGADPPIVSDCIQLDYAELPEDEIDIVEGGIRVDKYLGDGSVFTLEGGTTEYSGTTFINSSARGQIRDVSKPWARFNYSAKHWNVLAYYNKREAETVNMQQGNPFLLDADNFSIEVQTHWNLAEDSVRIVGGGSYFEENVESNVQRQPAETDQKAVFTQVDWNINDHVKLVGALRWDDSTLHDDRVSPKGSVVYSINPNHSVRLTYNEGFQLPTYADFFLFYPLWGVDLTSLEAICDPDSSLDCGFDDPVTVVLVGNESLKLEETTTWEVGYKGVIAGKALLTLDFFDSTNENFVSALIPQITADGRTNPNYGPWTAPAGVPGDVEQAVRDASVDLIPSGSELSIIDGTPIIVWLTPTTVGEVETRGADVGFDFLFGDWRISATASWLDFDIKEGLPAGQSHVVQPNAPEWKASVGVSYERDRWDAAIRGRWVDDFIWVSSATYMGTVEAYTTVDLYGNFAITDNWKVGLYVANALDDEHWEAWGGDLIGRRAMVYGTFMW